MDQGIGTECGICAVYLKDTSRDSDLVPRALISMLSGLQHRGPRSAGMSVYSSNEDNRRITTYKGVGKVSEVFKFSNEPKRDKIIESCVGVAGIAQTRYSTSGKRNDHSSAIDQTQPFNRRHARSWEHFSIGFNGNLANYGELAERMREQDYCLDVKVDTELLMNIFAMHISKHSGSNGDGKDKPNMFDVVGDLMDDLDGAYNVVSIFGDGDLVVFRDPKRFRPLVWGQNENYYAVASESTALEIIGIDEFIDVDPAGVVIFNSQGVDSRIVNHGSRNSFCQFEQVYFSKSNSVNDGNSVKSDRDRLGVELARIEPLTGKLDNSYIVVPAPRTSIPAAETYSEYLGVRLRHAIEKIDDGRVFINHVSERKRMVSSSFIFHRGDIDGRKVLLVDDSIVRGETSKKLVDGLRNAGATEVHVRSTEPPIRYPCFYGIDFPTSSELIANNVGKGVFEEEVARLIGANSVVFQTLDGLVSALAEDRNNLCLACLTGEYPTPAGQRNFEKCC
jgi:amidophosphoribosyltransferase